MRRMYWRPQRISRTTLALIAVGSLVGYFAVERFPSSSQEPYLVEKMKAAELAQSAFEVIKERRIQKRLPIRTDLDPARSGLIGAPLTSVTTNPGSLSSKQTSVNPNFAALVVHWLKRVGVKSGDIVAIGCSGSFPALNIAVITAAESLGLEPIIISSSSSSQYGANEPGLLWLDMERYLYRKKVIRHRSVAASLGGIEDRALGMSKSGRNALEDAIRRNGVEKIAPQTFEESINKRIEIYKREAKNTPIRVYINVGGGAVSVGRTAGKKIYKRGLNWRGPSTATPIDSVIGRFLDENIPVIHLVGVRWLAKTYGLPLQPQETPLPGSGEVFVKQRYNRWLTALVLITILVSLYSFVRSDLGFRLTQSVRKQANVVGPPEPMV